MRNENKNQHLTPTKYSQNCHPLKLGFDTKVDDNVFDLFKEN